jgi:hypothetical protein
MAPTQAGPKFCIDCHWLMVKQFSQYRSFIGNQIRCKKAPLPVNLVTGEQDYRTAESTRLNMDACSPVGKWFEAKEV